MKYILLIWLFSFFALTGITQSVIFEETSDVLEYMDGKTFYNESNEMEIEFGYLPNLNTYGIIIRNKNGVKFNFINVDITCYGSSAGLNRRLKICGV